MIKDSRHSQTVKLVKRENIYTYSKKKKKKKKRTKLLVTIGKDKNIQEKVLTNASFWCDVSWWTSLTRRRVGQPIRN